jgi:hypothetical protein
MVKQIIAIIALSIIVILSMPYSQQAIKYLLAAHDWIAQILTEVFSGGQVGNTARELFALLTVPFIVALIPACIYWFVRRQWFPQFMNIVWVVWLIQTGALIINATL